MISPAWPPVSLIGVRRTLRLARRLPGLGWSPIVLTVDPPGGYDPDPTPLDETIDTEGIEVVRVPAAFAGVRLRKALRRGLLKAGQPRVDRVLQIGINRFLKPDHLPEWTLSAVRAARDIAARRPIDAVWVTAGPFGSLLVGAVVARALDRPLVLDYRDPWTQAPPSGPRRLRWLGMPRSGLEGMEAWALRRASGVAYINDNCLEWNRERLGKPSHAVWRTIPNGFDPADLPASRPEQFDRPTVLYAGSSYRSTTLKPLLQALVAERRAGGCPPRLLVYGEIDGLAREHIEAHRNDLDDLVTVRPRIPLVELASKMRGASALLVLAGDEFQHAVGGKIFDYFLANRPILGCGPRGSPVAEILAKTGTGAWVSHDEGEPGLRAALRKVATGDLPYDPNEAELKRWSADVMAERMASLLDAACRSREVAA